MIATFSFDENLGADWIAIGAELGSWIFTKPVILLNISIRGTATLGGFSQDGRQRCHTGSFGWLSRGLDLLARWDHMPFTILHFATLR